MEIKTIHGDTLMSGDYKSIADLINENTSSTDLRGANLRWSDLRGVELAGANLRKADLRGANLRWADLRNVDLSYADLRNADLRGTNLRGASLSGANLTCTRFEEARGINYVQLSWNMHGELGRTLTCIEIDGEVVFFCGCFMGNTQELIDFIEEGCEILKPSRILAMETCLKLMEFKDLNPTTSFST